MDVKVDGDLNPVRVGHRSTATAGSPREDNNTIYLDRLSDCSNGAQAGEICSGTALVYTVSGGPVIGGLVSGQTYYAIRVDNRRIMLASTYCRAVGSAGDSACFLPDGGDAGNDPDPQPVVALALNPDKTTTGKSALHTLRKPQDAPLPGLVDGQSYFAVQNNGSTFKLASSSIGTAITGINPNGLTGGPHVFTVEGLDLGSGGSGDQMLIVDITSASTGTHQLIGGIENFLSAPSGDRTVTASVSGSGGGGINVQGGTATSSASATVSTTVSGPLTAPTILVKADAVVLGKAISANAGGGVVSIGNADATSNVSAYTTVTIDKNVAITARESLTVISKSELEGDSVAKADQKGLGAGVDSDATTNMDYRTKTIVDGDLTARDNVLVEAITLLDGYAEAKSEAGGLGADSDANDEGDENGVRIGLTAAETLVDIQGDADLTADEVEIRALVTKLKGIAVSRSDADALGADSDAGASVKVRGTAEVQVAAGVDITGNSRVVLDAKLPNVDVYANPRSTCDCLGGDTDARANVDYQTTSKITSRKGATITTASLLVEAQQYVDRYDRDPSHDGGLFDDGDDESNGDYQPLRRIFFESTVIMLGEPNPELEVDASGKITKITNVVVHDENGNVYDDDDAGAQIQGGRIIVQDIVFDDGADAHFFANDPSDFDDETSPDGEIWGNAANFKLQQTWDYVRIVNYSPKQLETNLIDTVNTDDPPTIEIEVDTIHGAVRLEVVRHLARRGHPRDHVRVRPHLHVPADPGRDPQPAVERDRGRLERDPRRPDREPDRQDLGPEPARRHPRRGRRRPSS